MPISQPTSQTETHSYHSLQNESTMLWVAYLHTRKEAKDINACFKFCLAYHLFNVALVTF